jgi:hypothetical protein
MMAFVIRILRLVAVPFTVKKTPVSDRRFPFLTHNHLLLAAAMVDYNGLVAAIATQPNQR